MTIHRSLLLIAGCLAASAALTACSQGSSPTEPTTAFDAQSKSLSSAVPAPVPDGSSFTSKSHGGGDDGSADDNGGGGQDDGNLDDHGDDGAPDPAATPAPTPEHRRNRHRGNHDDNPQPQQPRARAEFEGMVTAVDGSTILLAGGQRVLVDGQTVFSTRGDLRSLAALSQAVAANRNPRVEGRGTRQADGSILAASIKVEID